MLFPTPAHVLLEDEEESDSDLDEGADVAHVSARGRRRTACPGEWERCRCNRARTCSVAARPVPSGPPLPLSLPNQLSSPPTRALSIPTPSSWPFDLIPVLIVILFILSTLIPSLLLCPSAMVLQEGEYLVVGGGLEARMRRGRMETTGGTRMRRVLWLQAERMARMAVKAR